MPANIIETKPLALKPTEDETIKPTKPTNSDKIPTNKPVEKNLKSTIVEAQKNKNNNNSNVKIVTSSSVVVTAQTSPEPVEEQPALQIENNVFEYDLLSRQPAEYAEETYRVINNKATDKPRNRLNQRRTYDVSSEATIIHEATTANRLKPSQAVENKPHAPSGPKGKKPKIRSTTPLRVLKTTTSSLSKPAPQEQKNNRISGSHRHNGKGNRANNHGQEHVTITESVVESSQVTQSHKKSSSRSKPKR